MVRVIFAELEVEAAGSTAFSFPFLLAPPPAFLAFSRARYAESYSAGQFGSGDLEDIKITL
jgi:hypothetical protein